MPNNVLIKESELQKYAKGSSLSDKTNALLDQQIDNWSLAKENYSVLDQVQLKAFEFDNFIVKVQFNPCRIISTSAKVDDKSIRARDCFLCKDNLPAEQRGLAYFRDYLILVNPYPIFPKHLTIPKFDHIPQRIKINLEGMLNLTKDFAKSFTVFYNGPKCGASAPDHMHFQAGQKDYIPIDYGYKQLLENSGEEIFSNSKLTVNGVVNYLCPFFSIESKEIKSIVRAFEKIYYVFDEFSAEDDPEPMVNIITSFENGTWRVLIFPRSKHRPAQYFTEGANQILVSPASVDIGGICVTPRESDFEKMNSDLILNIFRQVCISKEIYEYFKKNIVEDFIHSV